MSQPFILFDLTRLIGATGRAAPTGIERVEAQYARRLAKRSPEDVAFVVTLAGTVRPVSTASVRDFLARQTRTWKNGHDDCTNEDVLANVARFLDGGPAIPPVPYGHMSREERFANFTARATGGFAVWGREMVRAFAKGRLTPALGAILAERPVLYLTVSADRMENEAPFARLKEAGVTVAVFGHDTIPLDYPELVRKGAPSSCRKRTRTLGRVADGVIANSHFSAARIADHLGDNCPKMCVAHLGIERPRPHAFNAPLGTAPYFLMVSTIEAKKNHQLILKIWRRMVQELGEKTPKLVIVGKRGWEVDTPLAMLDRVRELRPYVLETGVVPDTALAVLRKNAHAILMPSIVEGFGLPVPEALVCGTPVIASDIDAFREVAGNACELVDSDDFMGWYQTILAYADETSGRRAAALERVRAYKAPTWDEHFSTVDTFLDDLTGAQRGAFSPRKWARRTRPTPQPAAVPLTNTLKGA
ncbi:MAG: glycosyltransferase family 1 protein [Pseudomonadota bacterium]